VLIYAFCSFCRLAVSGTSLGLVAGMDFAPARNLYLGFFLHTREVDMEGAGIWIYIVGTALGLGAVGYLSLMWAREKEGGIFE